MRDSTSRKLFVAYTLPAALRGRVADRQEILRASLGTKDILRMVAPEKLHLTLLFLGEVPGEKVHPLAAAMEEAIPEGTEKPRLVLTGIGAFPSPRRPRVVWVGALDPTGYTEALAGNLRFRLSSVVPDLLPSDGDHTFVPHITIGYPRRGLSGEERTTLSNVLRNPSLVTPEEAGEEQPAFDVGEAALVESVPTNRGTRYDVQYAVKI